MSERGPDLVAALLAGDYRDVQSWDLQAAVDVIANRLHHDPDITVEQVRRLAKHLNDRRHFEPARVLCASWLAKYPGDATVNRLHAQALLDLNAFDKAELVLAEGLERIAKDGGPAPEKTEHLGLLGRSYKERFLATGDTRWLERAIAQYYDSYSSARQDYWLGINAVALVERAARENVAVTVGQSSDALAHELLVNVEARWSKNTSDPWLAATASEALLALGRCDAAELWLYRFLHHPRATPFAVGSYTRQLREVWQGMDDRGCAGRLFGITAAHEARTQGVWRIDAHSVPKVRAALQAQPAEYERNFLGEGTFTVATVKKLLASCHSIGGVHDADGNRLGTGFLMAGGDLADRFSGTAVFVTNAHVVGNNAIPADQATVTFELAEPRNGAPRHHKIAELLFTSPPGDFGKSRSDDEHLDVVVATLRDLSEAPVCLKAAPRLPILTAKSRAFIAGHPRGAGLQVSLHDSHLLDFDEPHRLVHYRTPTDPGSSGSPVFNDSWDVIAVHHGGSGQMPRLHGSGQYEANEGIAVEAIRRRLARQ
jgi:hypothetical protein